MKRVLVTGGAGYVGSHCVEYLVSRGYKVVILDNLERGDTRLIHPKAVFIEGDIADEKLLRSIVSENQIDGVLHFAAYAYVGESTKNPQIYYKNNTVKSICLFNTLVEAGVKNIVFSSTCATYGIPETLPIDETSTQKPINPYGNSKLGVEMYLRDLCQSTDVSVVALRYFNACGASPSGLIGELHDPETHIIPLLLQVAAGERDVFKVFGGDYDTPDGTCIRDYVHVTDLAKAHVMAYEHNEVGFEAFNLASQDSCSILELIEVVERVTKMPVPYSKEVRRDGDPPELYAKIEKAKNILGWKPECSDMDTIISSAWEWYQKSVK